MMTYQLVTIGSLTTQPPFSILFDIDPTVLAAITQDMRDRGFDESKPIDVWDDGFVVVDGHSRLRAAHDVGLDEVWVYTHDFADERDAIAYAVHNQRDRRNLTGAELLRAIAAFDKPQPKGGAQQNPYGRAGKPETESSPELSVSQPSRELTAAKLGTSPAMVQRARAVLSDLDARREVEEEDATITGAYERLRARQSAPESKRQTDSTTPLSEEEEPPEVLRVRSLGVVLDVAAKALGRRVEEIETEGIDVAAACARDRQARREWNAAIAASTDVLRRMRALAKTQE